MSMDSEMLDLAGEYVLGTLEGEERLRFEAAMRGDEQLREEVVSWQQRLAPLDAAMPPLDPPPALFDAITARIATEAQDNAPRSDHPWTVAEKDGNWVDFMPGITVKVLFFDQETKMQSLLMRFEPGAIMPEHKHGAAEECMMLSGDITFDDGVTLREGDYQLAPKGMMHAAARSEDGALVFLRTVVA